MPRVAFVGIGHWHRNLYLKALEKVDGVRLVGVSDPREPVARRWGEEFDCFSSVSFEAMCEEAKPDFVFALGRHCDMAESAAHLMREGIPFAMEKPCGTSFEEVRGLAELQERLGAYAAVPFVWRQSELAAIVRDKIGAGNLRYVLFRRMLGPPARYTTPEWDSAWMLDPSQSGGGCTLNLGVHWIDLFQYFMEGQDVEVVTAYMSNDLYHLPVEDYSILTLKSGDATCVTDTGYVYPGTKLDMHHSVIGEGGYLIATNSGTGELTGAERRPEEPSVPTMPSYPRFVAEVLDQAKKGGEPIANMRDMARVMKVAGDAYRIAGWPAGHKSETPA
jgi:predicted dehydrogenase